MKNKNTAVCHDVLALFRAGASIREIARLTGLARETIRRRIELDVRPPKPKQARKCLCCGAVFDSDGPHNRLCGTCRRQSPTELELWGGA